MIKNIEIYDNLVYHMDTEDSFFVIRGDASDKLVRDFMVKAVEYSKETAINPGAYLRTYGVKPRLKDVKGFSFQLNEDSPRGRDFMIHLTYSDFVIQSVGIYHSKEIKTYTL